jgi:lichenan operon transcriptional antiterminator
MKNNQRQLKILEYLVECNDYKTSSQIACHFDVSDRTIKEDIKSIISINDRAGINVISQTNRGYKIEVCDNEKFSLFIKSYDNFADFNTQNNRIQYILYRLLTSHSFVTLETLSNEMYISISTLKNDISLIKKLVNDENLKLTSVVKKGLKIEGDEHIIRSMITKYARIDLFSIESYNNLFASKIFSFNDIKKISTSIVEILHEFDLDLLGLNVTNLLIHLIISVFRIQNGYEIQQINMNFESSNIEFKISKRITERIEKDYGFKFSDSEIEYLGFCLIGKAVLKTQDIEEVKTIISRTYKTIFENFNIEFDENDEDSNALYYHTLAMRERLKYGITIEPKIVEMVRTKFVFAYEMAIIYQQEFYNYYQQELNDVEVCYIAVHFGAMIENQKLKDNLPKLAIISEARTGHTLLLKNELLSRFNHSFNIVGIYSPYEVNKTMLSKFDFVLSTEDIDSNIHKNYLKIPVSLDDRVINEIQKFIKDTPVINEIFKRSIFFKLANPISIQHTLSSLAIEFERQKLVENGLEFFQQTLVRENLQSTRFSKKHVLPHPIKAISKVSFISTIIIKDGIIWFDGKLVKLILYIGINPNDKKRIKEVFSILSEISSNENLIDSLIESRNYDEFIDQLSDHIRNKKEI